MQAVWDCGAPATRAEIEARLPPERHMAATTLLTLLSRLAERGFVRADKAGRGALYTALVSRKEYLAGRAGASLTSSAAGAYPFLPPRSATAGSAARSLTSWRALLERNEL